MSWPLIIGGVWLIGNVLALGLAKAGDDRDDLEEFNQ